MPGQFQDSPSSFHDMKTCHMLASMTEKLNNSLQYSLEFFQCRWYMYLLKFFMTVNYVCTLPKLFELFKFQPVCTTDNLL